MGAVSKDRKSLVRNKKAFRDYEVLERVEMGIALAGTEVKSVKAGHVSLAGCFVRADRGQLVVQHMNIAPYEYGNQFNREPERPRRLLAHRREIDKLRAAVEQKGYTLVPLEVYERRGLVKLEVGLCRGKRQADKRETLRKKTADREMERAIKQG